MSWSFKPGDRVVCVDAEPTCPRPSNEMRPVQGAIYTIREVVCIRGKIAVRLEEIVNQPFRFAEGYVEMGFRLNRFRPVRTSSIESLRAHLNTIPANRRVDA